MRSRPRVGGGLALGSQMRETGLADVVAQTPGSALGLRLPGEPVAHNCGLLKINVGLLWGIVACCFQLG